MLVLVVLAGCKDDGTGTTTSQGSDAPRKLGGIYPENWRCDTVVTLNALGELLGGTVKQIDSPASVPRGLPKPCNYEVTARDTAIWSFDVDCRDGMKQRADALFAQYAASSRDLVAHHGAIADAGAIKPTDAGVDMRAPEPAVEVFVGAKGLDHHGQGLIFIDDDAPCYVRVVGKDAARRLELARLLASKLTFANAPMTPRALPPL